MTREQIIEQYPIALAEKQGKQIQYLQNFTNIWIDCTRDVVYGKEKLRIKPEPTKRLPTIEEVEKWYLENRVFILKTSNCMIRITSFTTTPCDSTEEYICIGGSWYTIQDFCKKYNHYDGSSLYITE